MIANAVFFQCFTVFFWQTEDEALALAIQASLSASSTSPTLKNKFSSTLEEEDHALAKAIADSEKEERERRRRQQSAQQSVQSSSMNIFLMKFPCFKWSGWMQWIARINALLTLNERGGVGL